MELWQLSHRVPSPLDMGVLCSVFMKFPLLSGVNTVAAVLNVGVEGLIGPPQLHHSLPLRVDRIPLVHYNFIHSGDGRFRIQYTIPGIPHVLSNQPASQGCLRSLRFVAHYHSL